MVASAAAVTGNEGDGAGEGTPAKRAAVAPVARGTVTRAVDEAEMLSVMEAAGGRKRGMEGREKGSSRRWMS